MIEFNGDKILDSSACASFAKEDGLIMLITDSKMDTRRVIDVFDALYIRFMYVKMNEKQTKFFFRINAAKDKLPTYYEKFRQKTFHPYKWENKLKRFSQPFDLNRKRFS